MKRLRSIPLASQNGKIKSQLNPPERISVALNNSNDTSLNLVSPIEMNLDSIGIDAPKLENQRKSQSRLIGDNIELKQNSLINSNIESNNFDDQYIAKYEIDKKLTKNEDIFQSEIIEMNSSNSNLNTVQDEQSASLNSNNENSSSITYKMNKQKKSLNREHIQSLFAYDPKEYLRLLSSTLNIPGVYQMSLDTLQTQIIQLQDTLKDLLKEFSFRTQEYKITKLHLREKNDHLIRLMRQWTHDKERLRKIRFKEREILFNYFFSWREEAKKNEWNLSKYLETVEKDWKDRNIRSNAVEHLFWKDFESLDSLDLQTNLNSLEEEMNQLHKVCIDMIKEGLILEHGYIIQYLETAKKEWFVNHFDSQDINIMKNVTNIKKAITTNKNSIHKIINNVLTEFEVDALIGEEMANVVIKEINNIENDSNQQLAQNRLLMTPEHVTLPNTFQNINEQSPQDIEEIFQQDQEISNTIKENDTIENLKNYVSTDISNSTEISISTTNSIDNIKEIQLESNNIIEKNQPKSLKSKNSKHSNLKKQSSIHNLQSFPETKNSSTHSNQSFQSNQLSQLNQMNNSIQPNQSTPINHPPLSPKPSQSALIPQSPILSSRLEKTPTKIRKRRSSINSTKEFNRIKKKKLIDIKKITNNLLDSYLTEEEVVYSPSLSDSLKSMGPVKDFEEKMKEQQKTINLNDTINLTKTEGETTNINDSTNNLQSSENDTTNLTSQSNVSNNLINSKSSKLEETVDNSIIFINNEDNEQNNSNNIQEILIVDTDTFTDDLIDINTSQISTPRIFTPMSPITPFELNDRNSSDLSLNSNSRKKKAVYKTIQKQEKRAVTKHDKGICVSLSPNSKPKAKVITIIQNSSNNKKYLSEIETLNQSLSEKEKEIAHLKRLIRDKEKEKNFNVENDMIKSLHEERKKLKSQKKEKVKFPTTQLPLLPVEDLSKMQFKLTDIKTAKQNAIDNLLTEIPILNDEPKDSFYPSNSINKKFMRNSLLSHLNEESQFMNNLEISECLSPIPPAGPRGFSAGNLRKIVQNTKIFSNSPKEDTAIYTISPQQSPRSPKRSHSYRNLLSERKSQSKSIHLEIM